ncbi:MAG: hypothetical protein R2712_14450 [Vicinamibacterales bacterium]
MASWAAALGVAGGLLMAAPLAAQERAVGLQPYLMDEAREVALARSAAPPAVGAGAAVYVLGAEGYRLAVPGENGFACLVQRSFGVPTTSPAEFAEPRMLAPICHSPDAAATVMQRDLFIAPLVSRGQTLAQVRAAEAGAYESGRLTYPESAVVAYMLSTGQWLGDTVAAWRPHVMIWAPGLSKDDLMPAALAGFGVGSGLPLIDARYGPRQVLLAIPLARDVAVPPAVKTP